MDGMWQQKNIICSLYFCIEHLWFHSSSNLDNRSGTHMLKCVIFLRHEFKSISVSSLVWERLA